MAKRKLAKDEYIDRYGQVQRHSKWYMENKRRSRMRFLICGAALAVILIVMAGIGIFGKKSPDEKEEDTPDKEAESRSFGAADADLASGNGDNEANGSTDIEDPAAATQEGSGALVLGDEAPQETPSSTTAASGGAAPLGSSDPGRFYTGYETYSDGATQTITDESIISSYCVLVDLKDGHIVAGRDATQRMYPASMTKVMTILTAADLVEDPDDTFVMTQEITDYVWQHKCSTVGYLPDEEITVRELFYGTILPSGGDAAVALAYYTCGSIEAFADKMNEKAAELGISDVAHFTNPAGIFDEENYCTPVAMAMIMKAAEENDFLSEVLGTRIYNTANTEQHPEGIEISNWFIRRIEDKDTHGTVLGAKTGFVNESGNCAVSYLRSNDGNEYICVTGNAWSAWRAIYDHVAIYDAYVK